MRAVLLVLVLATSGCPGTRPADPVDLIHDGWSCYDYTPNRSHCELITSNCVTVRQTVPGQYKPAECRRVEKAYCFDIPGDQPWDERPADPPMHHEGQEHMWCYTSPEECETYSPKCVAPP